MEYINNEGGALLLSPSLYPRVAVRGKVVYEIGLYRREGGRREMQHHHATLY